MKGLKEGERGHEKYKNGGGAKTMHKGSSEANPTPGSNLLEFLFRKSSMHFKTLN